MTISAIEAKEEAQKVLDLKDDLNRAIVTAWEKGLLINIVIGEREHAVARIHPYPCPQLNMGMALDPLTLEPGPGEDGFRMQT